MNSIRMLNLIDSDKLQYSSDGIYLKFTIDKIFPFNTFNKLKFAPINIDRLKKRYGNKFNLSFYFTGKFLIKAGISSSEKSFLWIGEKTFSSQTLCEGLFEVDLSNANSGKLEIIIHALDDTMIYENIPDATAGIIQQDDILYKFIFPTYDLCCEIPLYCKLSSENSWYSFENGNVELKKNDTLDLLTYFNSFSAVKWQKYTNIDNLSIYLDFSGQAFARVIAQHNDSRDVIAVWKIDCEERKTYICELGEYPEDCILGLEITAQSDCVLYGGGYLTSCRPLRNIRLGIGITTYKREDAVIASTKRLMKAIAGSCRYRDRIELTVVDNGSTLKKDQLPQGVTIIPNRNLGGAGGFMRNLIHYQDEKRCTHCLFMDDDAFCEPEAIFRSMAFLNHVLDDKTAISGAMLSENIQFMQWENGAWFEKCCHPLKCNYDLRNPEILYENERETTKKAIYGAWWFFLFPIKNVKYYAFPFFVRGDDIEFSYLNDFEIKTLNGVGVWQEDFKTKESPQTLYFDIRSHILHHLLLPQTAKGRKEILRMLWSFFKRYNDSYQYDTAKSILLAFAGVMEGPSYWQKNMDTANIRKQVTGILTYEKPKPLEARIAKLPYAADVHKFAHLNNAIRKYSLNGHLLPSFLFSSKRERIANWEMPNPDKAFLRQKIYVCNDLTGKQKFLGKNTGYCLKNILKFCILSGIFIIKYGCLKSEYLEFVNGLKNDKFWKSEFLAIKQNNK